MITEFLWSVFEKTGRVDIYLDYKQVCSISKSFEDQKGGDIINTKVYAGLG